MLRPKPKGKLTQGVEEARKRYILSIKNLLNLKENLKAFKSYGGGMDNETATSINESLRSAYRLLKKSKQKFMKRYYKEW